MSSGAVSTGTAVPTREPVSRVALLTMLHGCERVLDTINPANGAIYAKAPYVRGLVERIKDAIAREPKATVPGADAAFHSYRLGDVRLCDHSTGVALIDVEGNATVLDSALVSALYDVCTRDRRPPVVEAREVRAGEFHASADVEGKP